MTEQNERHEDQGREARAPDAFVLKNFSGIMMGALALVFGGGGGILGSNLSGKIDETNKKIDKLDDGQSKLATQVTELRGQVTASEQGAARHDAAILSVMARLSLIEQGDAANREKVSDHDRRLSKLEASK